MKKIWNKISWIVATVVGSAIFAFGFAMFLQPNDMNAGGISGLAQVVVEVLGVGSIGTLSMLINLPLFILGGLKIGKRFFAGSLLGMVLSSVMIDLFAVYTFPTVEPLLSVLYGGVICGLGLGVVFISGTSTGGSDILIRLLKLRYRNVPIGQISLYFDAAVVVLTGVCIFLSKVDCKKLLAALKNKKPAKRVKSEISESEAAEEAAQEAPAEEAEEITQEAAAEEAASEEEKSE